ncbi:FGGY family carbohydrate kinase [Marispirochaeta sp.]|uniref:FGGY family carbohydrate kinase n=1 Tax=Marispirochaeta sp. TaxID=2038653 RepID=UPI0029C82CAE|nr:FGGY family carbohydrate kinase [Marispirochaeta sp.]
MAPSRSHLAVDIGTSSLKAALLDEQGTPLSSTKVSFTGMPGADMEAWNPSVWDAAFQKALASLADTSSVSSVTVSGNGPTLIPLSKDGHPSGKALLWLQRRTPAATPPDSSSYFLPSAAWFRENYPGLFRKTAVFTTCPGYLSFRLTGVTTGASPGREFSRFMWDPRSDRCLGFRSVSVPGALFNRQQNRRDKRRGGRKLWSAGRDSRLCRRAGLHDGDHRVRCCSPRSQL